VGRGTCSVHLERPAVGACDSCGRAVCVACAIPFRGRVLCSGCAARELGEPVPPPPTPLRSRTPDIVAAALVALALVVGTLPWDRLGGFTSFLSAWRPTPEPWPLVANLMLVAAGLAATLPLRFGPRRPTRGGALAYGVASIAAATAAAGEIYGSPGYIAHTPIPFIVVAFAVGAGCVGLLQALRRG
jgi:hypothetical protein